MLTLNPSGGRGCGTRKRGGTYLTCGTSPNGLSIDHFIFDPGIPWPYELSRAPKILADENGVNHVYLLIGEGAYKSPWFHIDETANYGLSRLVSDTFPFHQLTPFQSEVRCIYPRGIPRFIFEGNENEAAYYPLCKVYPRYAELLKYGDVTPEYWGDQLGRHPMHDAPEDEDINIRLAKSFCTFAHKDISWWLATDRQRGIDDDDQFTIDFPSVNASSFSYQGHFGTMDWDYDGEIEPIEPEQCERIAHNKENWLPAILLRVPLTHIEMPFEENEKSAENARNAGFDVFITPY